MCWSGLANGQERMMKSLSLSRQSEEREGTRLCRVKDKSWVPLAVKASSCPLWWFSILNAPWEHCVGVQVKSTLSAWLCLALNTVPWRYAIVVSA